MAKRKAPIKHAAIVERFAARLRELRTSRGMTQAELAQQAQVTVSYIWKLESAGAAPGIDLIQRLAEALGTSVQDLLPGEPPADTEAMLQDRARQLFDALMAQADRETLIMLCPLLARLGESPTRRR